MVASHHDDLDARSAAGSQGFSDAPLGWIHEADEADEDEAFLREIDGIFFEFKFHREAAFGEVDLGECQYSLSLASEAFVGFIEFEGP